MNEKRSIYNLLTKMLKMGVPDEPTYPPAQAMTNAGGQAMPTYAEANPQDVKMLEVVHPDGRLSQYPPAEYWDDWVEWDGKAWPRKVARRYMLIPTVCFNCESACGLLAYVDKDQPGNQKIRG
jgi:hypothetical protein